jgi:hydrogenase maturation protease
MWSNGDNHARVLIVGIGSTLRSDDAVGRAVVDAIEHNVLGVEAISTDQILPEHAELISRFDALIVIDASRELPPGDVRIDNVRPLARRTSAHSTGVPGMLAMCRDLFGHVPATRVVGVGGASFELGESLSPCVARAVDRVLDLLPGLIEGLLIEHRSVACTS